MLLKYLMLLPFTYCISKGYSQNKTSHGPIYPKGEKAFLRLITDSIDYNIPGAVFKNDYSLKITINKNGIAECETINGKSIPELSIDESAVYSSINKSLKWEPAYKDGKPVETKLAFRIGLSFQD